jgi:cytochrome c2
MIRSRIRTLIVIAVFALSILALPAGYAGAEMSKTQKGEKIFSDHQCSACHTVHGKGGNVGPDLSKVGNRRDEAWMKKFLPDPASVKPGVIMPPFKGSPEELDALIAYLRSLK